MSSERYIERSVGIFVFIGIILTATLILYFGKVGDRFRGGYGITVEFSNAGGLVKGAQVLYAGVLVGKVHSIELKPDGDGVEADVTLFQNVRLRRDSTFMIKQSGLLGDQHIVVVPHSKDAPFLEAGDKIVGEDPFDFNEVANQASEAMKKLNLAINKLSSEFLTGETLGDFKLAVKNFGDLAKKLQLNSEKFNSILGNVKEGQGTIGKLITDDGLFTELKTLIHNWRVHGLLYREKVDEKLPPGRRTQVPNSGSEDPDNKSKEQKTSPVSSVTDLDHSLAETHENRSAVSGSSEEIATPIAVASQANP